MFLFVSFLFVVVKLWIKCVIWFGGFAWMLLWIELSCLFVRAFICFRYVRIYSVLSSVLRGLEVRCF